MTAIAYTQRGVQDTREWRVRNENGAWVWLPGVAGGAGGAGAAAGGGGASLAKTASQYKRKLAGEMKMNVKVGLSSRLSSDKAHITDCFSAHLRKRSRKQTHTHMHTHCEVISEGITHDIAADGAAFGNACQVGKRNKVRQKQAKQLKLKGRHLIRSRTVSRRSCLLCL